jgi:hypothetical protein
MSKWKKKFCEKYVDCENLKRVTEQLNIDRAISETLNKQKQKKRNEKIKREIQNLIK